MLSRRPALALVLALGALGGAPAVARACGCFAPPDPSTPLVQAGERILFSVDSGVVTAHIQIQYSGKPGEFGWLLPLPAVPKDRAGNDGIDLGVDELFSTLGGVTRPRYQIDRFEGCPYRSGGPSASDLSGVVANSDGPLVAQGGIGPYDFAILKADSKDAMLAWLQANRYFVPAGTDAAAAPYVRPGAYFLALKLKADQLAGDLQPVVLRYRSDLPMIPINLTGVGATPDMPVQVYVLGRGRAIPRNYYHVVLNDAQINWLGGGSNYELVVTRAVKEAPERHAFVTEYAGSSGIAQDRLDWKGRFSDSYLAQLAATTGPAAFIGRALSGFTLTTQLLAILQRHVPMPAALRQMGVSLGVYYQRIDFYLGQDRAANPGRYADIAAALAAFDPAKAAAELRERIVTPTLEAGALLRSQPYLTRLYMTISPEDMNLDPVFSFNPGLPDVSNVHRARIDFACDESNTATLYTEAGWRMSLDASNAFYGVSPALALPYAQRVEVLRETGLPEVVSDNSAAIAAVVGPDRPLPGGGTNGIPSGCRMGGGAGAQGLGALGLLVALGLLRRRR